VPHEQHDHRADDGADQARALVGPVPADRLADPGGDEGAGDAKQRGEDEARRVVGTGRQEARDDAGDKTDDDGPQYAHDRPRNDFVSLIFARKR
jgi:hypothetical protein